MSAAKMEKMLRDRLKLLKTTSEPTHIISCPFENAAGVAVAKEISERFEENENEFCYYPNEDCPQSLNVSWLETWMEIADNTERTGGTVFVVHRTDGKGRFGCDAKGPGSLDGQAQPGEIKYAIKSRCKIEWCGYADAPGDALPTFEPHAVVVSSAPPRSPPWSTGILLPRRRSRRASIERRLWRWRWRMAT